MNKTLRLRSLFLLAALLLIGSATLQAQCPATLGQWLWRIPVTVNNGGAAVANYFLLLKFDSQTPISAGHMRADGGDLRIADANCSLLNYWRQSGLNTTATYVWAVVPNLPSGTSTYYIYYGNPSGVVSNQASNVFGSNLIGLWSYTEGSGGLLTDWVGGQNMTVTATWGAGFRNNIGACSGFSSGGRVYLNGSGPSVGSGSFTALIYANVQNNNSGGGGLIGNYTASDNLNGWVVKLQGGSAGNLMLLATNPSVGYCQGSGYNNLQTNSWHQVVGRRDITTTHSLFVDGTRVDDPCTADTRNVDGQGPFEFGHTYGGGTPVTGSLSFAAMYNVALTDAQIQSFRTSMYATPEPLATIGVEEGVAPPVITQQPSNQTICVGQNATFTIGATGQALTYQWRKNGQPITGATGTSYTITNAQGGDAGVYDVVVRGQVTSSPALLTVNTAPGIITQPVTVAPTCPGSSVTFSVEAAGGFLTYQWRKNGTPIEGATNTKYTIPSAQQSDVANYDVIVGGSCGAPVTSTTATFSLLAVPSITSQPLSQTVCRTQTATFTVGGAGAGLTYQWRKNGQPIDGATNPTLQITAQPYSGASYDVVVKGACGAPAISNAATLTVALDPIITEQPLDRTVHTGQAISFGVKTMGGGILSYQWQRNGVTLPGHTSDTIYIQNVSVTDVGDYNVVIRGTTCSDQLTVSNKASLILDVPPQIVKDPENVVTCDSGSVTLSVSAAGTGLSYQWRKNGTNIPGATSRDLKIDTATGTDAGNYDVVIHGSNGVVLTSTPATVTINQPASISAQPSDVTVCPGKSANFTVTAAGSGITYQWRKNGTDITGATAAAYTIPAASIADTGMYDVMINGTCSSGIGSGTAKLILNDAPAITGQPKSDSIGIGGTISFTVTATGTNLTYQWRKDGVNIPGATNAVYSIPSATLDQAGNYDVVVTGLCDPAMTSAQAKFVVRTSSVPDLTSVEAGSMLTVVPQPAYGVTSLQIHVPQNVHARAGAALVLFDINGKAVLDLSQSFATHGFAGAEFDAALLPSGTYYCHLTTPDWNGTLGNVVVKK